MRRIESIADEMRGTVTYDLGNGRYATFDARALQTYGLPALMADIGVEMPTERVPVVWRGRRVGSLPADFEPITTRSRSFLYDVRPGDFRRESEGWIADKTMGPGDLEAVDGFVWEER